MSHTSPDEAFRARRRTGGYGTGEGSFGIVENHAEGTTGIEPCDNCPAAAVLYFVDSADAIQHFACLEHAAAIAYDVAVASTHDSDIPVELHGPDDRRWPSRNTRTPMADDDERTEKNQEPGS